MGTPWTRQPRMAEVVIPTASVKVLNATPYELVPAPGAGKWLEFISVAVWLDFASIAYNAPNGAADLKVRYTDGAGALLSGSIETTGFISAGVDALRWAIAAGAAGGGGVTPAVNATIVLHNVAAFEYAAGDSPLRVQTLFRVRQYPW